MAVERRSGIEARLIADQLLDLPPNVEDGVYRIIQEALNNVLKHAEATRVEVHLDKSDNYVNLIVGDNGKGFDPTSPGIEGMGGIGVSSMRERATRLGGRLAICSTPGSGTQIKVHLPLLAVTGGEHNE